MCIHIRLTVRTIDFIETGVLLQNFIYRLIQLLQIKDPQFLLILLFSDFSSDKPFIQHLL